MTKLEIEDVKKVAEAPYNWNPLSEKTILISGGTGFIGSFLCEVLHYRNSVHSQGIKVLSIARHSHIDDDTVHHIVADVCNPLKIDGEVDYVLHLASNTHPEQYKNDPVGTITANVFGTYNLLALAAKKNSRRFLLASSCEIYGEGKKEPMDELYNGYIDCNTARAGYNESKRVAESLCQSYKQQYGVDSVICRLARVYGADKTKNDTKAMAQFIRNAVNDEDIVLKSKGLQRYSYIYVADAVSGILAALLNGESGNAYNVSADDDGLSLGEYAAFIASLSGKRVVVCNTGENPNASKAQNALLDNSKIKGIGFKPIYSTKQGIERTYKILREDRMSK